MVELYNDHLRQEDEEEYEDEALSLCDLPLDGDDEDHEESDSNIAAIHSPRSSSEFFEFFSNLTSHQMSSAEDIIFCGRLVPFKSDLSLDPQIQSIHNSHSSDRIQGKRLSSFRRRSESLFSSAVSRSHSINNTKVMMRSSRSLDYRRLERFSSSKTSSSESENSIDRNLSVRSNGRGEKTVTKRTASKPRWYVLMFGVVKPPKEMELSDIKSRQFRRNPSGMMFPPSSAADTSQQNPPASKGSSNRLLKLLSCRDNTSVAVTTSFCLPPPA